VIDLVVVTDLDVMQAAAAGQEVGRDVHDVNALLVRRVPLQEVEVPVDVPGESGLAGQEVDGPEDAGDDAPNFSVISERMLVRFSIDRIG
jgi:hypothetical protein